MSDRTTALVSKLREMGYIGMIALGEKALLFRLDSKRHVPPAIAAALLSLSGVDVARAVEDASRVRSSNLAHPDAAAKAQRDELLETILGAERVALLRAVRGDVDGNERAVAEAVGAVRAGTRHMEATARRTRILDVRGPMAPSDSQMRLQDLATLRAWFLGQLGEGKIETRCSAADWSLNPVETSAEEVLAALGFMCPEHDESWPPPGLARYAAELWDALPDFLAKAEDP